MRLFECICQKSLLCIIHFFYESMYVLNFSFIHLGETYTKCWVSIHEVFRVSQGQKNYLTTWAAAMDFWGQILVFYKVYFFAHTIIWSLMIRKFHRDLWCSKTIRFFTRPRQENPLWTEIRSVNTEWKAFLNLTKNCWLDFKS